jgi:mevalonate kinase
MEEDKKVIFECLTSACGKIIISGEHAVVYDKKAISCPIRLFTKCHLEVIQGCNKQTYLNLIEINKTIEISANELESINDIMSFENFESRYLLDKFLINSELKELFLNFNIDFNFIEDKEKKHFLFLFKLTFSYFIFLNKLNYENCKYLLNEFLKNNYFHIQVESEIPPNAGLGSSAAYNISLISCLLILFEKILTNKITYADELNRIHYLKDNKYLTNEQNETRKILSFIGEKIFHAKPSGIDNITGISDGMIIFQNFNNYEKIQTEFINNYNLYLVDTNKRRETKTFVHRVSDFKLNFGGLFMNCVSSIDDIAIKILNIFKTNSSCKDHMSQLDNFEKLVNYNQKFLEIIGVSSPEIDEIVYLLIKNGITSKLTGAGGGGFVLAFIKKEKDIGIEYLRSILPEKYKIMKCQLL